MSIKADEYEVIVKQDSSQCYFNQATLTSNGFDQGAPTDYCYSNIGTVSAKQDEYRDSDGNFAFRLTYYGQTATSSSSGVIPPTIELLWTQKQWIQESVITDVDLSQLPQQEYHLGDGQYFSGLGIGTASSYLDGSPGLTHTNWYNAVLSFVKWTTGIPGFNGASAISNKLEILVPEGCSLDARDICHEIEANTDRIDSVNGRIDTSSSAVNGRIDTLSSTVNGRIDTEVGTLNGRIDSVNLRVDNLRDFLQGADFAHAFNGDIIGDNRNVIGDSFEFTKIELLLLCMNILIIVFGLFICWRGGLFSKDNGRKYTKVSRYYESEDVDKPINA